MQGRRFYAVIHKVHGLFPENGEEVVLHENLEDAEVDAEARNLSSDTEDYIVAVVEYAR